MVKISDIAAELGVSRSLVSKVLSGHMGRSSVRPALAEKIRKRAAELGYVPNVAARVLFSGRQNTVGVFIARYGQPGSGLVENFLDGVSSVLHRNGQRMLLQFFRTEEDFRACMDTAHPSVMDGVIVAGMQGFDLAPGVRELLARNLPVATCFSEPLLEGVPNAGIDQREVGRTETLHVLSRGARAPLFITAPAGTEGTLRFDGYRAALLEAGLPFREELVCKRKTCEVGNLPDLIRCKRASGIAFDGVIAESDRQSAALLRLFLAEGLRVPEDIMLIGVDNSPICEQSVVTLSSVSRQDRARGVKTAELVNALIAGKPAQSTTFAPRLCPRESTARKRP